MPIPQIVPVVLSGGSGTRLWPLSRSRRPKQLLSLTAAETMLQLTVRRTPADAGFAAPVIVANGAHADMIESQLAEAGATDPQLILEPIGRNTAPAIALAALALDADQPMLVMPSDHVIADVDSFRSAVQAAVPLAQQGWLVTFGITPDQPETGYGYIKRAEAVAPGIHRVERFVEKPDADTARAYLAEGGYSWNGGIFLFTAGALIAALEAHAPKILVASRAAMDGARRDGSRIYPDADAFGAAPSEAIDTAVMEKAEKVAVVPVEMGWSDVGSWDALHSLLGGGEATDVHHGEIVAIDTERCLIRTDGPLVAAVGVKDLIVIATDDAVLILPRGSSQDVKRAVEALKKDGHVTL